MRAMTGSFIRFLVKARSVQSAVTFIRTDHTPGLTPRNRRCVHKLSYSKSEEMASVKEIVNARIAGKKVVVFSKSYCPFCVKAKKAFEDLKKESVLSAEDYDVMEIENDPNCDEIQNYLQSLTGGRSVPRVFIGGKFIGGGDDTVRMKQSGELKAKLNKL